MKRRFILLMVLLGGCASAPSNGEKPTPPNASEQVEEVPPPTGSEQEEHPWGQELEVHFIDVGNADATLYKSQGCNILIDAGEQSSNVASYLQAQGIKTLDLVIATHPHADHIGGMSDVIAQFEIGDVYMSDASNETKTFERLLNALEQKQEDILIPETYEKVTCGDLEVEFLYPGAEHQYKSLNEESIVTKISYHDFSITSLADIDGQGEQDLLSMNQLTKSNVVKVSHHGSSNQANHPKIYNIIQPEVAIITSGLNNKYGHPHMETLEMLKQLQIPYYRSDFDGTIIITSDGVNYDVQ